VNKNNKNTASKAQKLIAKSGRARPYRIKKKKQKENYKKKSFEFRIS
jgi:hypothetical protein